jgi:hypothetical protein
MNDLPDTELLSAYLDGELTAAEQAKVERLLAADPSARRVLDDWRALRAAMQALPQQKLGEDLSRHVLRIAERRLLTTGEPGDAAPVPPARSILRRIVTPRAVAWASLAVGIALIISVYEQHNRIVEADKQLGANKEVAVALHARPHDMPSKKPETAAKPCGPAPAMRAASRPEDSAPSLVGETVEAKNTPATEAAKAHEKAAGKSALDFGPSGRALPKSASRYSGLGGAASHGAPKKGEPGGFEDRSRENFADQDRMRTPAVASKRSAGPSSTPGAQARLPEVLAASASVVVVYCDITAEAARNKAIDTLLDVNGVARRRGSRVTAPSKAGGAADAPTYYWYDKSAKAADETGRHDDDFRRALAENDIPSDNAEVVCVEATPVQIDAVLAGLAAQPDVFRSVLVKPSRDPASLQLAQQLDQHRRGGAQQRRVADAERENSMTGRVRIGTWPPVAEKAKGGAAGLGSTEAGGFDVVPPPVAQQPSETGDAPRGPAGASPPAPANVAAAPKSGAAQGQAAVESLLPPSSGRLSRQKQQPAVQMIEPAARQRVLFVLRIIDASAPAEQQSPAKSPRE